VFDQQDSGNLCFGVQSGSGRFLVKYAGAQTVRYQGTPAEAVTNLRRSMPVYEALQHPVLVTLREHYAVGAGYVAVFDWFEGEVLSSPDYPSPAKYGDPRSPHCRFRSLPVELRLECLDSVFAFHHFAEKSRYVAVDFYDGSILYDFEVNEVRICDIDCYRPGAFINEIGRMWGSSRFMSPEEFELGAPIDWVTNVFNMGAAAFVLVGGARDRARELWEAGDALYEVAIRAVSPDREARYQSVADFSNAWARARRQEG